MGIVNRLLDWRATEQAPEGRTAPDAVLDMHQAADFITRLRGYANHEPLCPSGGDYPFPADRCTCGLSALLEEIDRD